MARVPLLNIDVVVYGEVSDPHIIQTFPGQIMLPRIVLNVGRAPKGWRNHNRDR